MRGAHLADQDDVGEGQSAVEAEEAVEVGTHGELVVHLYEQGREQRARERERGDDGGDGGGRLLVRRAHEEERVVAEGGEDGNEKPQERVLLRNELDEARERELAQLLDELPIEELRGGARMIARATLSTST